MVPQPKEVAMSTMTNSASSAGRALYHAAWEVVGQKFFDVERLKDWSSWEHKFDDEIDNEETARRFIAEMVASLGDSYTCVLDDEPAHDAGTASQASSEAASERQESPPASADTSTPAKSDVLVRRFKGDIGYIGIYSFLQPDLVDQVTEAIAAVSDCVAFIIDLRGNGGGLVTSAASCCEFLVARGPLGTLQKRLPDGRLWHRDFGLVDEAMVFITKVDGEDERVEGFMRRQPITVGKPVVVLIDEGTGSAAEMMAAAIIESDKESGLVTCIGVPSFGKGIAQTTVNVLDKVAIQITCGRFLSPTDVWFGDAQQSVRNPVMPHIHVEPNAELGANAQLAAAVERIKSQLA